MDGVKLDRLTPGKVCDVSPSLGSWLLAQGYADLEMRSSTHTTAEEGDFPGMPEERGSSTIENVPHSAADRRRRPR